jgi:hypothetical protein
VPTRSSFRLDLDANRAGLAENGLQLSSFNPCGCTELAKASGRGRTTLDIFASCTAGMTCPSPISPGRAWSMACRSVPPSTFFVDAVSTSSGRRQDGARRSRHPGPHDARSRLDLDGICAGHGDDIVTDAVPRSGGQAPTSRCRGQNTPGGQPGVVGAQASSSEFHASCDARMKAERRVPSAASGDEQEEKDCRLDFTPQCLPMGYRGRGRLRGGFPRPPFSDAVRSFFSARTHPLIPAFSRTNVLIFWFGRFFCRMYLNVAAYLVRVLASKSGKARLTKRRAESLVGLVPYLPSSSFKTSSGSSLRSSLSSA